MRSLLAAGADIEFGVRGSGGALHASLLGPVGGTAYYLLPASYYFLLTHYSYVIRSDSLCFALIRSASL